MSWSGVSGFQLPAGLIVESKAWSRQLSSVEYLPACNEEYGPDPRFAIGPNVFTVLIQLSLLRYLPTRCAMSWKVHRSWQASLMVPCSSRMFLPSAERMICCALSAGLPVSRV